MPTLEKRPMVSMTLNIPDSYEEAIATLKRLQLTPSRSEFIRSAVREYLRDELTYFRDLDNFNEIITKGHPILLERAFLIKNYPKVEEMFLNE